MGGGSSCVNPSSTFAMMRSSSNQVSFQPQVYDAFPIFFQDRAQLRDLASDHGPDAAHAAAVRQDARQVQEGPPRGHDRSVRCVHCLMREFI